LISTGTKNYRILWDQKISVILEITRIIKNKIFKQGIGIAEESQETRRDCCGGNVNHKSLF